MNLNEQLGGNRPRGLDINQPKNLRPTELSDLNSPHVAMNTFFSSV
jgi:hypothetical protein